MKRLILITGDIASGKSHLADALSHRLNISVFEKDLIKEHFCDMYGYKTREENRELSVKAVNYMIDAFLRFASLNQDIILEANFRHDELSRIKQIADENKYDVTLLVLRGELEFLYKRFLDRLPTRHIAHKSMRLDESIEKFKEYIDEQRNKELVFTPHVIEVTKLTPEEVLKQSLDIIGG